MPNALNEAMGHGCVPVVTDVRSGIPEVVRDGVNGYLVPVGDVEAFARRLALLYQDPQARRALARQAHQTVLEEGYRAQDMVNGYRELFHRVLDEAARGAYRRPRGSLSPPPQQVSGIQILPGNYERDIFFALPWKKRLQASVLARYFYHTGWRGLRRMRAVLKTIVRTNEIGG
jgi:hypothetical protein